MHLENSYYWKGFHDEDPVNGTGSKEMADKGRKKKQREERTTLSEMVDILENTQTSGSLFFFSVVPNPFVALNLINCALVNLQ